MILLTIIEHRSVIALFLLNFKVFNLSREPGYNLSNHTLTMESV